MTNEWRIRNDVEWRGYYMRDALSRHSQRGTNKTHDKLQIGQSVSPMGLEPDT
jgi:hypothetical protein